MNDLNNTFKDLCDVYSADLKSDIFLSISQHDSTTAIELSKAFPDCDQAFLSRLLEANDIPRLYLYISNLGTERGITRDCAEILLKGVSDLLVCLCNVFWNEYKEEEVDINKFNRDVIRYALAKKDNIDLDSDVALAS